MGVLRAILELDQFLGIDEARVKAEQFGLVE
jgi:hypothetical protein